MGLRYIEEHKDQWQDKKGASTWKNSLQHHVFPAIGRKPICEISDEDIFLLLNKIWRKITETATRVRGRVEKIFDYAKAHGWYEGDNPARWKGHLEPRLPQASKIKDVRHYPAVPYDQVTRVMKALASMPGVPAKAARFNCLTVLRPGVVRATPWSEIDLENRLWSIPAHRMKMKRAHTVPLTDSTIAILISLLPLRDEGDGDWVFPGQKLGKTLSDVAISKVLHEAAETKNVTVHGFRSTFRDWVSEETVFSPEVAEMALAHEIKNKVEAAYRRGDLLEKRRVLMNAWDQFCTGR
ncbi:site-specific integrase [Acetobacter cerevisiae]|uniref:Site-specific integrase n=1 Tax=Acetobacter cerevisiae TaxID=178900 RepID=A0ABT1EXR3_9PROT|nr:site-specific integrase [Acetobacter cerevisiae]MCP1256793.1 site-specific integrase [Acetobacter cerevisiae]